MNNILITGGAGYIGSHAVKLFLEKGHNVFVIDNYSTGHEEALKTLKKHGNLTYFNVDLCNLEELNKIFDENKFDCVLHFAALSTVGESMQKPHKYFLNNIQGSLNLFESMRLHDISRIIFSSTCATYGNGQYFPIDENHPQNPTDVYGESKLAVEKILKWFSKIYNLNYVIFRYFNVCGNDEKAEIGYSKNPSTHLVDNAVKGALNLMDFKLTCAKVGTPDGTPIRDYVDVRDLVQAHYFAYEYLSKGGESNIFNLGTGTGYSVLQIISEIEKLLNVQMPRSYGDARAGEYSEVYATYKKAEEILGWKPIKSLEESVSSMVAWYTSHPDGFNTK